MLFDAEGSVVTASQRESAQHYPQPGWVEHDPEKVWFTQLSVGRDALARAEVTWSQIAAIGITNQRETTVVWDWATGRPVSPALVWQCRRTADFCRHLKKAGWAEPIRVKTGDSRRTRHSQSHAAHGDAVGGLFGETDPELFGGPIPFAGVAGDQHGLLPADEDGHGAGRKPEGSPHHHRMGAGRVWPTLLAWRPVSGVTALTLCAGGSQLAS